MLVSRLYVTQPDLQLLNKPLKPSIQPYNHRCSLATQLLRYAYVPRYGYFPSSYAILSKRYTFSNPSQATLTFQDTQLRLRSKIPSYAYVPRYAYVPKDMVTFQATQLRFTFQDTFRFQVTLYCIKRYAFNP